MKLMSQRPENFWVSREKLCYVFEALLKTQQFHHGKTSYFKEPTLVTPRGSRTIARSKAGANVNEVLAQELHKPVIKKFKRRKVYTIIFGLQI